MLIEILPSGEIRFIYSDSLRPLMTAGTATTKRVSDVEPDAEGRWTADLSKVGGPILGPFELRDAALAAEVSWLEENRFGDAKEV